VEAQVSDSCLEDIGVLILILDRHDLEASERPQKRSIGMRYIVREAQPRAIAVHNESIIGWRQIYPRPGGDV
jgi:hypothetical protein